MSHTPTTDPPRRGLGGGRTAFHVRGVPVRGDLSLLIVAFLVVTVYRQQLDVTLAASPDAVVLAASVVAAVLFFASILAHEIGHAFASLDRGIPVRSITLFFLGGVTESTREAETAKDEFIIVGIGPFTSLVLGGLFGLAAIALDPFPVLAAVCGALGWTNLLLAIFNVVPGYPLDGGRLLRSLLWAGSGRPHAATRWAARVGQAFALLLIVSGIAPLLGYDLTLGVAGYRFGGGLWEALIGLFLLRGATEAHSRARGRERLAARTVRDVMGSVPPTLRSDAAIADVVEQVQTRPSLLWPVAGPDGRMIGAVALSDVDAIAAEWWPVTPLGPLATRRGDVAVDVDESMEAVLDRLAGSGSTMLVVVDGGRPVGLVTPSLVADLVR